MTVLVVGATGRVASQLTLRLKDAGTPLRLLVRNGDKARDRFGPDGPNLEYVVGPVDDAAVLAKAFAGADVAFLGLGTSETQEALERGLIDAARRQATPHVVRLSVLKSNPDSDTEVARRHGVLDADLRRSGLPHTLLRPSYFMSNLLLAAGSIAASGRWFGAAPNARIAMIDARDVGDAAAAVILDPALRGADYDLTGPEAVTMAEAAALISSVRGREATYVAADVATLRQGYAARGVPTWLADYALGIDRAVERGDHAEVTDTYRALTGASPRTLKAFLEEHRSAFAPA